MSVIDMTALRALVAEEIRKERDAHPPIPAQAHEKRPPQLWTADDVASYLKASRSWVYQQAEAGRLPCLKVVGLLRFDPNAVRAFAEGHEDTPANVLPLRGKGA